MVLFLKVEKSKYCLRCKKYKRTSSGPCAAIFRAVFSDLFLAFKMWVIWGVGAIKSASLLLHEVWLVKRRKFGRAIAL